MPTMGIVIRPSNPLRLDSQGMAMKTGVSDTVSNAVGKAWTPAAHHT
jgi:hypothetical protein